jgi:hypothetical protein
MPWAQIIGAAVGGLGALFGNNNSSAPSWLQIPDLMDQINGIKDVGADLYNNKGKGANYANWILDNMRGKKGGDPSKILDMSPFKAQDAAENEEIERNIGMATALDNNAFQTQRATTYAKERAARARGARDEQWLSSLTGMAMGVSEQSRARRDANYLAANNAALAAFVNGHQMPGQGNQLREDPNWFQRAMQSGDAAYQGWKAGKKENV